MYAQYGAGAGNYNQVMPHDGPVTTTQVTIPTDLAGCYTC
jgi:hypothetical protein